jgi:hypothetical protein
MPLTPDTRVKETASPRRGTVLRVHATTCTVEWDDHAITRVSLASVQALGRERSEKPIVRAVRFKSIERRFEAVVRQRMRDLGLTFDQLAERSGVPKKQLLRLSERDDPATGGYTASTIERLARALSVSPGAFWELS